MRSPRVTAFSLGILLSLLASTMLGQVAFRSPQPGEIYREYIRSLNGNDNLQVPDPNIDLNRYPQVAPYIPAPPIQIWIGDLSGATRAELMIVYIGGHVSTVGQKMRWNDHEWVDIPLLDTQNGIPEGHHGYNYMMLHNMTMDIPLSWLHEGDNYFQGTSGGQADPNYGWGWGQWGWYAMMVRIYYSSDKPHATGQITSHSSGGTLNENPTISASVTSGSAQQIDFLAYYDDYDTDGDGVYLQYHHDYMMVQGQYELYIKNHVGTATGAPWSVTWSTDWVPDQPAGQMKLIARIKDANDIWYVTPEVTQLSLVRNGYSVKLYKPLDTPERCWVHGDNGDGTQTVNFNIPPSDNLATATAARYYTRLWNGANVASMEAGQSEYRHFNSWTEDRYGADHHYTFDARTLPVSALQSGTNTWQWFTTVRLHHGIEVLWPGPALAVRYTGTPSNDPPSITQQPVDKTVADGQPASFSVTATGGSPLLYQWQKNTASITGANSATYSIEAAALADSGALFRCIVSNSRGADTSSAVKLIVTPVAPTITTHPSNVQVSPGDTATFTVVAAGSLPRYYEWEKNGTPVPGATAASYLFVAAKADSGAAFRCKVTNSGGSVTSDAAFLIVGTFPPTITQHPVQAFVRLGQTATFHVNATGSKTLRYQWQRDSIDIADATNASYTTPPVASDDNGRTYRCLVSNDYGTAVSEAALLTVTSNAVNLLANGDFESGTSPWSFYTNGSGTFVNDSAGPASVHAAHLSIISAGDNVQLAQAGITLEADTAYTLLFKAYSTSGHDWDIYLHKDTTPYTSYGLWQTALDLTGAWKSFRYDFTATGFTGTVSDGRLRFWLAPYDAAGDRYFVDDVVLAKTSLLIAPTIAKQPLAKVVNEGETATFSVVASGTTPFTYQWEKNQVAIPGATSASYTTPPVAVVDDKSQFRCVVSNLVSSVTSDPATLTVTTTALKPPPVLRPSEYYLAQNHPNPFNPSTVIEFGLPTAGHVMLKVSNLLGQEVKTLVDEVMGAGTHQVTFHADGLPSGVYLYRMQSGNFVATRKFILVR